jgi:DNA polymerase-1
MSRKMLLIDGHAVAYRGYHATAHRGNILTTSKGEWTNAVYVFVNKLLKTWREEQPDYIIVAYDMGKTFRHEQFDEYKANRARMPDELRYQMDRIREVIGAFNIPIVTCEGYEADDVLGTLAKRAGEQDIDSIIMTGDTDLFQLVDEHIQLLIPHGRYGDDTLYGPERLSERYNGLTPEQLIDHKALVGDNSDNIPGLRGIGDKTATSLLTKYGSIEGIYEHIDEIKNKRQRGALESHQDEAHLYKDLITIRTDAPVELDLQHAQAGNFDRDKVLAIFGELEFHSLLDRIPTAEGDSLESALSPEESEPDTDVRYVVVDTERKLDEMVDQLKRAQGIAFDTETTSTDAILADLVGLSFATAPGKAWYVPVGHGRPPRRGSTSAAKAEQAALSDLPLFSAQEAEDVSSPETEPAADTSASEGGDPQLGLELTMIAEWVIDPSTRALGLKAMAFNRLGVEMTPITDLIGTGKSQITMDRVPIVQAAPYAAADADMTLRLVEPLTAELQEREQWDLFTEIEMPLIPILVQMSKVLKQEQANIEEQIYELVGHEFNVNSTKQLSEVLFDELDLPKRGIRKTVHGYSTAADALALLQGKHPIIDLILEQRQISKLESTYVSTLPTLVNPRTGRVHTSYNQTGTVTGRLSSSNPNLQNIPIRTELGRQIRKGFVAQEGWVFLAADYSQVELRILAHVSQDPELLDAFAKNQDVHARTAAAVYGIPIEEVTKDKRNIAKTVNFGLIYGQSAYGLSQQTGLDFDEAERFIATYFERYPGVRTWLDDTRALAYKQGYVETLLGRRRYFPELQTTRRAYAGRRAAAERQAINAPIQGTAADILKIAMIRLANELQANKLQARMVLQVHDEVVLEVPKAELEPVTSLVREVMEGAYTLSVPLKVDAEVGENWLDMEPA